MSQVNQKIPKEYIRIGILIHSAIAGASIAAVLQLASRETITQVIHLSIFCFAVAIPASVGMVFISQLIYPEGLRSSYASLMERRAWPILSYLLAAAEQLSFFGGFLALFWSFHSSAGIVFIVSSMLTLLTVSLVEKRIKGLLHPIKG